MKTILFALSVLFGLGVQAQTTSSFLWTTDPASNATSGPNGTSIGSSATVGTLGGVQGINPGLPKMDINLVVPGLIFDVPALDVSVDFQRDESQGSFFTRGSYFNLRMSGGNLNVTYRISDGGGGFTTVSSGNVYSIPNDNTFRNYRFVYDNATGIGRILVNGTAVWTNDGPDNRNMYWVGAGDVTIGSQMDGSGNNRVIFANMVAGDASAGPLPIELKHFQAEASADQTIFNWVTVTETNNDFFTIEKSLDGNNYEAIAEIDGAGNSTEELEYFHVQDKAVVGTAYYRLKQADFDGQYSFSEAVVLEGKTLPLKQVQVFPNPTTDFVQVSNTNQPELIRLFDRKGSDLTSSLSKSEIDATTLKIDVRNLPAGTYFLTTSDSSHQLVIR